MESVKQYTKSRQILQRNVFRHCTDFTFPVSLLFLLPGPGRDELAIMMAPGPALRLMGREVWPRFRHLSLLLGFNMAGCLAADKARRRGRGHRWEAKTNKHKEKYNMLVNKRIRRIGHGEIAFCAGVSWFDKQHFAGYILYRCMYRLKLQQWNFSMQGIVRQNGKNRRRCWIDFFPLLSMKRSLWSMLHNWDCIRIISGHFTV